MNLSTLGWKTGSPSGFPFLSVRVFPRITWDMRVQHKPFNPVSLPYPAQPVGVPLGFDVPNEVFEEFLDRWQ